MAKKREQDTEPVAADEAQGREEPVMRLRLLKNVAHAGLRCYGQAGAVVWLPVADAQALIEAGAAVQVDADPPAGEAR